MSASYISKTVILFLLLPICLSLFAEEIPMDQPSGTIAIQGAAYQPGIEKVWMINTGTNKPILFTYTIDLEIVDFRDCVVIYNVDDYGNTTLVAHFIGLQSGSVSTTIPNGKAKVVFYSDIDGYADSNFFTGFTMSFSVDNSMTITDNIYVSGKVGIGSTEPQEKLHINGNVYVAGNIRGNSGMAGALRVKTSKGYIDIGPKNYNTADFDTDRAKFVFNKPLFSATGEYSSENSTNLSLQTRGTTRMTLLNSNGNVGIGTTTPSEKLEVNGKLKVVGNVYLYGNQALSFQDDSRFSVTTATIPNLTYSPFPMPSYGIGTPSTTGSADLWLSGGSAIRMFTAGNASPIFNLLSNGNVGIGTIKPTDKLSVNGVIRAKEVKIDLCEDLADYVFHPDYELMPLHKVEAFVKTNRHLPEIPSAAEVKENGLNMGEMQNKLLQKIEELTLYMIEQQKRIEQLEKQINK